jgi:fatty-acyl-CoA synthase
MKVLDAKTLMPVPADGRTMGEVMMRGSLTMKGYFKNPSATDEALAGGWYHSGDLAIVHPDGYIELRDRSKDIIISGGENISSIEIEDVLYSPRGVLRGGTAIAHQRWGEVPCAFVS